MLWAVLAGALLKFVLNEGLARWQLATGQTLLEGVLLRLGAPVRLLFLLYLLPWSWFVGSALISACGATTHALLPVFEDAVTGKIVWGCLCSLAGLALVLAVVVGCRAAPEEPPVNAVQEAFRENELTARQSHGKRVFGQRWLSDARWHHCGESSAGQHQTESPGCAANAGARAGSRWATAALAPALGATVRGTYAIEKSPAEVLVRVDRPNAPEADLGTPSLGRARAAIGAPELRSDAGVTATPMGTL